MTDKEKELYRALQHLAVECTTIDQSKIDPKYIEGFIEAMDRAHALVLEGLEAGAFK